ncbi:MAG TPA: hypothetical protein VHC00_13640 [Rhizobiaceae bacterium]|nr:hypothetical protein [Rhizobiaceae bacterium]
MADVVQERRKQRRTHTVRSSSFSWYVPLGDIHESAGDMKHANGMSESSVGGSRKRKFGDTQLLDTTEALKLRCVDKAPSCALDLVLKVERNQPVDRVAYALQRWHELEHIENMCNDGNGLSRINARAETAIRAKAGRSEIICRF